MDRSLQVCFGGTPYALINATPGGKSADAPAPSRARLLTAESGARVCSVYHAELQVCRDVALAAGAAMHSAFVHWALPLVRCAMRKWVSTAHEELKRTMASTAVSSGAALCSISTLSRKVREMLFQAAAVRRLAAACSQAARNCGHRVRPSVGAELTAAESKASKLAAALEMDVVKHLSSLISQHHLESAAVEAALERPSHSVRQRKRGAGCRSCGGEAVWRRPDHWGEEVLAAYPPEDYCDGCWDAYYEGYCALCRNTWCQERRESGRVVCETCLSQLVGSPIDGAVVDAYDEYNPEGEEAMARSMALIIGTGLDHIPPAGGAGTQTGTGASNRGRKRKFEETSAYEQLREENIERNRQVLEQLGLVAPLELTVAREKRSVRQRQAASRKELVGEERDMYIAASVAYASGELYPVPKGRQYAERRHRKMAHPALPRGQVVTVEWVDLQNSGLHFSRP